MKESDLFSPLKKYFNKLGYKVYVEVPCFYRGVDFVAVKGDDHIAVEMKLHFNDKVVQQASQNRIGFGKSYVAFPSKKLMFSGSDDDYWKMRESTRERMDYCENWGIGILQLIQPHNIVVEILESKYKAPHKLFDFSQYRESKKDESGLPFQKGVSAGYYELKLIKAYIRKHPLASWREIYENVQNHYSSPQSLSGSMSQWRGFSLQQFKKTLN